MAKRTAIPLLGSMLKGLAPRIGASVLIEPRWEHVSQITFRSGRRRYIRYSCLDLNPLAASEIAKDKDYATFFLKRMGYPTVPGEAFFSNAWGKTIGSKRDIHAAFRFAKKIGFPVIVKPNGGSQGREVTLVYTKRECYRALRSIFKSEKVALVQRRVSGRDYRMVVLDSDVISAYERVPLSVLGDGRSTVFSLLLRKQRGFKAQGRDTLLQTKDPRIPAKLKRQGLTLRSIPKRGERIFLLDNANLSTGGDAIPVKRVHPAWRHLAIRLTKDMGLRLCGVDLMVEGSLKDKPGKFFVLEINAAPGLDHYAQSGKAQRNTVERMYLKILKRLE